ncbi:hypothetical protein [Dongia sp.]|uniref:hypothetical protein n=1 Tax=Dongia sp. TaxID=1977262 RepID=UPI0035AF09BF
MTSASSKCVNWRQVFGIYISTVERFINTASLRNASDHPLAKSVNHVKHLLQVGMPTDDGKLHIGRFSTSPDSAMNVASSLLSTLFRFGIDSMYWLGKDGSYIPELERDSAVRRFLTTRLPNPDMCEDVLAEMTYRGYLKGRGLTVEFTEEEGMPDMKVLGSHGAFHAEVKALHNGSNLDRVSKVIEKANKQIKRTPEGIGVCAIQVVETIQLNGASITAPLSIPATIEPIIKSAQTAMSSMNFKSVAETIVTWDEFDLLGRPPGWIGLHAVRRSVRLSHVTPRASIPHNRLMDLEPAATIHGNILFAPSNDPPKD